MSVDIERLAIYFAVTDPPPGEDFLALFSQGTLDMLHTQLHRNIEEARVFQREHTIPALELASGRLSLHLIHRGMASPNSDNPGS